MNNRGTVGSIYNEDKGSPCIYHYKPMADNEPRAWPVLTLGGTVDRMYKDDYYM